MPSTLEQEEAGEMESYIQAQTRIWRERYRAEGIREVLRLQAETRFGADTAARLADLVAEIDSLARLTDMLRWIIVCETAEELLAKASGRGNGR